MGDPRELRKLCREVLRMVLTRPSTIQEIYSEVIDRFPTECNDAVLCTCGGISRTQPEWKHQVRWAMQDLKYQGFVSYDQSTKLWSPKGQAG